MADRSLKLLRLKSSRRLEYRWLYPFVTSQFLDEGLSAREFFEITRRAATRPKSEKPRRSREGKRSKRLKRQQQERKEKYRKRQCRANHEQQHQLSKLRATHNVQHQRCGARNFSRRGLPPAPNPTPRKGVTAIVLRIRLHRYCGIASKNNLAIAPNPTDAFQKNSVENHVRAASLHASIIILIDIHRPLKTAPSGDASVARRERSRYGQDFILCRTSSILNTGAGSPTRVVLCRASSMILNTGAG